MQIRYIRDWVASSDANDAAIWQEVQAYNVAGTNVALNKTVTASTALSYSGGSSLAMITNGVINGGEYVFASGGSGPLWVQVDLGSVMEVSYFKIYHYFDGRIFNQPRTEVSVDGTIWITVRDYRVNGTYSEPAAGKSMMLWQTPFTNWQMLPGIWNYDLNRWEGNYQWLKLAEHIDLADAGNYFTTKNAEAALVQLRNAIGIARSNNLLGTIGNFELDGNGDGTADGWSGSYSGATFTLSTTNVSKGSKAQKIQSNAGDTANTRYVYKKDVPYIIGRRYVALVEVVTDGTSTALISMFSSTDYRAASRTTSGLLYVKGIYTEAGGATNKDITARNNNAQGTAGWVQFDAFRVYEIDANTYAKIDVDPAYTGAALGTLLPYTEI